MMEHLQDLYVVVAAVILTLVWVTAPVLAFLVALTVVGYFWALCDKLKALLQRCSTRAGAGTTTSGGGTGARTTTSAMTE